MFRSHAGSDTFGGVTLAVLGAGLPSCTLQALLDLKPTMEELEAAKKALREGEKARSIV